jgi:hypothetical protein
MLATLRAIDSRSRDCGNDGVFLQRIQMLATLRAADSRSEDFGNDGFFLQRVQMSAILSAADSRSRDCGNDEVFYSVRKRQQLYALQIPAQETAGMTGFSIARTNVGNFTRCRFPLRGLRE